jgi:hypothetical protein
MRRCDMKQITENTHAVHSTLLRLINSPSVGMPICANCVHMYNCVHAAAVLRMLH